MAAGPCDDGIGEYFKINLGPEYPKLRYAFQLAIKIYKKKYLQKAKAELCNSKIKPFRAKLRGDSNPDFFLFRLEKLFA
jgi:hypothetical protein